MLSEGSDVCNIPDIHVALWVTSFCGADVLCPVGAHFSGYPVVSLFFLLIYFAFFFLVPTFTRSTVVEKLQIIIIMVHV